MITRRGGEGRGGGTASACKGAACQQIGLMAIHFSHFQDPFPDVDLLLDYKIFKLLDPKVIASQGCVTLRASSWGPGEQRLNTSLTPSGKDKEEQKKISLWFLDTWHIIIVRRSMQRPPVFSVQLLDFYLKAEQLTICGHTHSPEVSTWDSCIWLFCILGKSASRPCSM